MTTTESPFAELHQLEDAVRRSDGDGLRARWESGRCMLTLKVGKQLPQGQLDALAKELGVVRSEINARMKFAAKFPTDAEVSTVVESFRTWSEIKKHALIDVPRRKPATTPQHAGKALQRAIDIVENIDSALLAEADQKLIVTLAEMVRRLKESVVFLKEAA